jgi:beta-glucuronidase
MSWSFVQTAHWMKPPFHIRLSYEETISIAGNESTNMSIQQKWNDLRLWNLGHPELYKISVDIGQDDKIDRIGFRLIDIAGGKIRINHKEAYLQGINRHEEHPEWGLLFRKSS